MAEEFQGGVCEGNWWNSPRNLFRSSPCSLATTNNIGSFGWPNNHDLIMNIKTARSSDDPACSASDDINSVVIQDVQKPHHQQQMMGISLSSSSTPDDWNQDLIHDSGRSEENYSQILQEAAAMDSSSINLFKQVVNQNNFPLSSEQPINSISSTTSTDYAITCQGISAGFPLNSASYSLLQTLFDTDSQPHQSLLDNQAINYSSSANYNQVMNSNEFLPSLPTTSTTVNSTFAKQQNTNHFHFNNNAPASWNPNVRASFLPSTQSQFVPSSLHTKKPNIHSFNAKNQNEESSRDLGSEAYKKASNEPAFKRPRIETPSPLPTFKVRKEKLGDRITALQQLVSPFGKTDTASVLHEAIEYIKFLHDQVSALSSPYLKYGSPPLQRPQAADKHKDQDGLIIKDLKSRGLCLVPISSTFPVAAETTTDFWTPTFGGSFK